MYPKKYSLRRIYLILLWYELFILSILVIGMFIIMPVEILIKKHPIWNDNTILFIEIFLLFVIALTIWRKATFTKKDFVEFIKSFNFKNIKRPFYRSFWSWNDAHRYSEGFIDGIYIVARIDMPHLAYSPSHQIVVDRADQSNNKSKVKDSRRIDYTGKYMDEESRIELFSLIKGPFNVDVKIKIEDDERDVPTTDCPEIDKAIRTLLSDVKYFYARLIFNKDCLRMTIIGGSWEGERFRQKIIKGFEIFQAMNNELRKKYTVGSWDNWDVRWDKKGNFFYLAPKEGQA
ncbi:MAG: hypothetical protein M1381_09780 [Deltaproteobacteria bacterium]|nr:hypothetical protein [Deltaproteobacteria bacterium]